MKDALFYKFRRPTIGQICSSVCTNKGGHRNASSNKRPKAPRLSRGLLSRPPSLEQSKRRGLFFVIASLVVDSTDRGHRHCSGEFEQLLLTWSRGVVCNTDRLKVHAAAAGIHTVLRYNTSNPNNPNHPSQAESPQLWWSVRSVTVDITAGMLPGMGGIQGRFRAVPIPYMPRTMLQFSATV